MPTTENSSHKVIGEKDFAALVTKCKSAAKKADESRGELGALISNAAEHKNLHAPAFALFRRLAKMTDLKRAEFLFHFDIYRERGRFDAADDLLPDRQASNGAGDGNGAEPDADDAADSQAAGSAHEPITSGEPATRSGFKKRLQENTKSGDDGGPVKH